MKLKFFTLENTWLSYMSHGWGNGYVIIPPDHPLYEKHYDSIDVDVHGGLTWSDYARTMNGLPDDIPGDSWIIGFDTAHYDDGPHNWPEHRVMLETKQLAQQCEAYSTVVAP